MIWDLFSHNECQHKGILKEAIGAYVYRNQDLRLGANQCRYNCTHVKLRLCVFVWLITAVLNLQAARFVVPEIVAVMSRTVPRRGHA